MAFIGVGGGTNNKRGELKAGKGVCERGRRRRVVGPLMDRLGEGIYDSSTSPGDVRVVVFGATGYIGRYVTTEFAKRGYQVSAFTREKSGVKGKNSVDDVRKDFADGVQVRAGIHSSPRV
uniref:NmrA-like domain-containing protein n=1 Tax=Rhodosorus marinus TaxID=101924 RepID=A0A7S3E8N1_9RHOD|mmetsp:Transcript_17601/g.71174  ORF Transcript_17601/g.71174 Transcript_17601/m.71174 type:complete len:120 (+) Transcript_17601:160-519(+)